MPDPIAESSLADILRLSRQPGYPALAERSCQWLLRDNAFAFAQIDPQLNITLASPNLRGFASDPGMEVVGRRITEVLWEWVGMEHEMELVLNGQKPMLELEDVNRLLPGGSTAYLTFRLCPWDAEDPRQGLILLAQDHTRVGVLTQQLTQERHDLLLARAQLAKANLELERLARTDPLTGLLNRRGFDLELAREFERSTRFHHPLSLLLLDVDHFKNFNDTHGHPAGDERLRHLGRVISASLGPGDFAARYGGEEFAIVLPETDEHEAGAAAESFRTALASTPASPDGKPPSTISIGIASCPRHSADIAALVQKADDALYRAKRSGRNRCEMGTP